MQILVLYQSRNGHTRQAAESIAENIRKIGHHVTLKSVWETLTHEYTSLSTHSQWVIAEDAPHLIHLGKPELVIDTVRAMLHAV